MRVEGVRIVKGQMRPSALHVVIYREALMPENVPALLPAAFEDTVSQR